MKFRSMMLALAFAATPALADEVVTLRPGAGQDLTEARCAACHTLNYIRMNSPFLNEAGWTAEVTKMRKVFGAPMEDAEASAIIAYLVAQYGPVK
jgi:sulfite dehydrogenase (cytochrome) subunit B